MDLSQRTLPAADFSQQTMLGAILYGPDEEVAGRISRLIGGGRSAQAIVGPFVGPDSTPVNFPPTHLDILQDENRMVHGITTRVRQRLFHVPPPSGPHRVTLLPLAGLLQRSLKLSSQLHDRLGNRIGLRGLKHKLGGVRQTLRLIALRIRILGHCFLHTPPRRPPHNPLELARSAPGASLMWTDTAIRPPLAAAIPNRDLGHFQGDQKATATSDCICASSLNARKVADRRARFRRKPQSPRACLPSALC